MSYRLIRDHRGHPRYVPATAYDSMRRDIMRIVHDAVGPRSRRDNSGRAFSLDDEDADSSSCSSSGALAEIKAFLKAQLSPQAYQRLEQMLARVNEGGPDDDTGAYGAQDPESVDRRRRGDDRGDQWGAEDSRSFYSMFPDARRIGNV